MFSRAEENYIKCIFKLSGKKKVFANTNSIAERMQTKAASVTDMVKKLNEKQLVEHVKYKGARLTDLGDALAIQLLRKHRLWEVFLTETLDYSWEEVHEIAEQLEHIKAPGLIDRLDHFLGYPKHDPHGAPIPDKEGNINRIQTIPLNESETNDICRIMGVGDDSKELLQFLKSKGLTIGTILNIKHIENFDGSIELQIGGNGIISISSKVASQIFIKKINENEKNID